MADNDKDGQLKQEEPTQRRLEKAREEGQVTRSREVGNVFFLLAAILLLSVAGSRLVTGLKGDMAHYFTSLSTIRLTPESITPLVKEIFFHEMASSLPVFVVFLLFAVSSVLVQGGVMISPKAAAIKWSRVSPGQGFKRLFSVRALEELVRYSLKVLLTLTILFYGLRSHWLGLPALVETGPHRLAGELYRLTFLLVLSFLPLYAVLAASDYLFQRFLLMRSLRMTRTEIREESKETEGDPHVRARIRSIQRAMARRRMMSKIRQATVVITNPTHFAVALRYDPETMTAPVVVAKGMDEVAFRIREVASEVGVPIVEDPPLARGLYRDSPLDREIPVAFYEAVARILSILYQKTRGLTQHEEGRR